eukprot:482049_1
MVAALNIVSSVHSSSLDKLLQRELNHQVIIATKIVSKCLKNEHENIRTRGIADEMAGIVERSRDMKQTQQGKNQGYSTDKMNLRPSQQRTITLLKDKLGYAMRVKPSSIEDAGWGLWVDGIAPTGSVVGIFPGVVYAPKFVRDAKYQKELFPDPNFQLVMRCDNYVVDCKESAKCPWHPWGIAQYSNHPIQGTGPNALQVAYDIPAASDADWWASKNEIFPLELRRHVPYKYRKTPGFLDGKFDKKVLVEGVLLVAMRDLENEEVFVNYRFPKTTWHPDWYHPVDKQEDDDRWEGVWK